MQFIDIILLNKFSVEVENILMANEKKRKLTDSGTAVQRAYRTDPPAKAFATHAASLPHLPVHSHKMPVGEVYTTDLPIHPVCTA